MISKKNYFRPELARVLYLPRATLLQVLRAGQTGFATDTNTLMVRDFDEVFHEFNPDGVTGTGTLNNLMKWTPNGETAGNSIISDNGALATIAGSLKVTVTATFDNSISVVNKVQAGGNGEFGGAGAFGIVNHCTSDVDKFIVIDSGWLKYRTGDDVLSDIGAASEILYGEIYTHDNAVATDLAAQDTLYQMTVFSANGESYGTTPDHTNDHITIGTTGKYLVLASISAKSAQTNDYSFEVMANNGADSFENLHTHRTTSTSNAEGAASISGIASLTAGDTIELWVQRTDGGAVLKSITATHINLIVSKIG